MRYFFATVYLDTGVGSKKYGVSGSRGGASALEQLGNGWGVQTYSGKFKEPTTAPQFISFQGRFGNNEPTQTAPKLSATAMQYTNPPFM